MKTSKLLSTLAATAGLVVSSGTASAAVTSTKDVGLQSNGFPRTDGVAAVGKAGGGNFAVSGYTIFSTQAIVAEYGALDFSSALFNLAFDTVDVNQASPDLAGGTFVAHYIGFYENVADIVSVGGFWNGTLSSAAVSDGQTFDTGVTDTAGAGQNLLATGFTLIDAETTTIVADSGNDYVAFKFTYTNSLAQASNTYQELGNITLSTVVIPEPSTALLGGLGLLTLLRRRRA